MACTSSLPPAFASSHNGEASLQPNPSPIHTGGYCLDHRTTSRPTWAEQESTASSSSLEYSDELYLEDFESEYEEEDDQYPNTPVCQSDIDDDHFDADNEPDEQFEAISGVHYILDGMASTVDVWRDFEYDPNHQYAATPEGFEVMNQNNYHAYMQVYGSLMDVIDNVPTIRVFHEMVDWVTMILMVWRLVRREAAAEVLWVWEAKSLFVWVCAWKDGFQGLDLRARCLGRSFVEDTRLLMVLGSLVRFRIDGKKLSRKRQQSDCCVKWPSLMVVRVLDCRAWAELSKKTVSR